MTRFSIEWWELWILAQIVALVVGVYIVYRIGHRR